MAATVFIVFVGLICLAIIGLIGRVCSVDAAKHTDLIERERAQSIELNALRAELIRTEKKLVTAPRELLKLKATAE